ncbi:MAG: DNRLRE domain-containing protein [Planctomycetota bacterium]|nr:DNRLRE domain-containing protein [Planctomycetota bacterium]
MRTTTWLAAAITLTSGGTAALAFQPHADENDANAPFGANSPTFQFVALPDTQNYSEFYPEIFDAQTRWVVDNARANNIRYVSHVGDVVNHGDRRNEWNNARAAMDRIHYADIPYGVTAGNHDITPSGSAGTAYIPQYFREYFGPQTFAGKDFFKGASPSGMSSFQTFTGAGKEWLVVNIECDTPYRELEWAQGVLAANRDKAAIITTHRYLQDAQDYTGGVPLVPSGRYPSIWYGVEGTYTPDGIQSNAFFDEFVRRQSNVFMVHCGHFHEEYRQTSTNVFGRPVHEVLHDYQDDPNGGDGWLRQLNFDTAANRINVESYSVTRNEYRAADESRFSLNVDFDAYRARGSAFFQNGVNAYAGTQDTWVSQANPGTSYGGSDGIVVDDDVNNSPFNDRRGQGLLRFDGMFTSTGEDGKVPLGASISQATLSLFVPDDIDNPLADPDMYVFLMTRPWDESSTWDSLGGGLTPGNDYAQLIATFLGDNDPDDDTLRTVDVTAAVAAWASGTPNYGFAIISEIISGNDDGIEMHASEFSVTILRPSLEVFWTTTIPAPGATTVLALGLMLGARRRRA